MIANCVPCRGHYLVIDCDIFIFPSSGSVTHGHFLVIHLLWTVCGLDPFSVPRTENLTPRSDQGPTCQPPGFFYPGLVCFRHLLSLMGAPSCPAMLARNYPFWCSVPHVEIWKADMQPRNGFSAAYAFLFPVRMFYPLIPPNHHSPWLIWVLRDSVMQSKLP